MLIWLRHAKCVPGGVLSIKMRDGLTHRQCGDDSACSVSSRERDVIQFFAL